MPVVVWLLIASAALLLGSVVLGLIFSFAGVWERMDNMSKIATRERIRLAQFGFIVMGNRTVVGGQQTFFGFALGSNLWMRRRDFGVPFLTSEGFPPAVARQVEGQIMARYRLQLARDHNFLEGVFVPFRVEFSADPPRVTAMHPQPPVPRKYRRIETIVDAKAVTASASLD